MKPTGADNYLLERIRSGDQGAWSQLVDRFEGRLLSFARGKLSRCADAEDVVQDTFISFIKSLPAFREESSIESYLFAILRRKIADTYRSAHSRYITLIQDVYGKDKSDKPPSSAFSNLAADDPTASSYALRDEERNAGMEMLTDSLNKLVGNYKSSLNFRDLQIVELLFYSQLSNTDAAKIMGMSQQNIGVIKHRCIKHLREDIEKRKPGSVSESAVESLLTEVWESARPSCPKRNTIGAFLLQTLEEEWQAYVDFHLNKLGCHFCRANLKDLQEKTKDENSARVHARIMESTIGFLHKP